MKVKFANRIYEVLFTKELAGLTMYAVEDEPNHVDWLINVEVIDDEKEELKKIEQKNEIDIPFIEIPFGAKDSEFLGANYCIPEGFHAEIKGNRVFIKKGEKKSTWSEEDETGWTNTMIIIKECAANHYTKDSIDLVINWLKSLKDRVQPKQEWSEEDDIMAHDIDYALRCQITYSKSRLSSMSSWIYELKNRVQSKQEWSEEDEIALGDALWCCKQAASIAKDENDMGNIWYAERWLKSLKDRIQLKPKWKPSDEQLKQLGKYCPDNRPLTLLYEQLKKLRDE